MTDTPFEKTPEIDFNFDFGDSDGPGIIEDDSNLDSTIPTTGLIFSAASSAGAPEPRVSSGTLLEPVRGTTNPQTAVGPGRYSTGGKPDFIDKDDFDLIVSGVYQEFTGRKKMPDIAQISRLTGVGAALIKKTLATEEFRLAVTARGIPWNNANGLTAQQMLVAQIITNPTDKAELKVKLRRAGVTYPQYRAWMSQPAFSQYMVNITEGMLTEHIPDFNTVLTKKGLAGDLNAIKYINELSGRHDPNRQQVTDLQNVVIQLLDIIQRHVKDPETMQGIAAEFSMAMNSKTSGAGPGQQIIRGA